MIRITYCPRCRSTDENCPACGEPVRALRTAQMTYPNCESCGKATEPYYSPPSSRSLPGIFSVACPIAVHGGGGLFDSRWDHTDELVAVSDAIARRRIAIKLEAERDQVLKNS